MRQRGEGCWRETLFFSPSAINICGPGHFGSAGSGIGISRVSGLHSSLRVRRARASSVCCIYCIKPSVQTLMHRYSHYIYILAHKQTKPSSLLQATRNLPRRLNSACCDFGPGASPSTPLPCPLRVIFSSRPSPKASMCRLQCISHVAMLYVVTVAC